MTVQNCYIQLFDYFPSEGMVALHYAAWQGRPEPVHALLQKLSPVNEQALNGETPLHLASQHGHIHVVSLVFIFYLFIMSICNFGFHNHLHSLSNEITIIERVRSINNDRRYFYRNIIFHIYELNIP